MKEKIGGYYESQRRAKREYKIRHREKVKAARRRRYRVRRREYLQSLKPKRNYRKIQLGSCPFCGCKTLQRMRLFGVYSPTRLYCDMCSNVTDISGKPMDEQQKRSSIFIVQDVLEPEYE